ncbi:MAG TPA: LPS biosynthesis protein WbpP [Phycisphaerales bacterium]|nr:LPS biosynthesis protein WbpP [Phycisphaerales bacterium]HCD34794.1 LPS biosynthesis protein WbpP [Phycisphaerales bacterium]|tara:strand:+ start:65632 stop:66642 length:1011 start_codon:yes stop_codon:yes gene_type:complete
MTVNWQQLHGDFFTNQRALITGGCGFIGSHIAEALVTLGADVTVLDNLSGCEKSNLDFYFDDPSKFAGKLEFVQGSILDKDTLQKVTNGRAFVFHQAAIPSVPRSIEIPVEFHNNNVNGTMNVLEAARAGGVQRLTFAASSSAYGDSPTMPKIEVMPPLPKSPYAANKLAGETMMRAYANCYDLDAASLRYFNIFGPRQNANSAYSGVIAIFCTRLIQGQPVTVHGKDFSRDFTYVANAVHANLLAMKSDKPIGGEVINIACGIKITIEQLARTIAQLLNRPDLEPIIGPARAGDVKESLAGLDKARELLGYEPIVDFDAGLAQTLSWYQQELAGK